MKREIKTSYLRSGRMDYDVYVVPDGYGRRGYISVPSSIIYKLVKGPYCSVHVDMLRDKFKICELEHANYYIYPKSNLIGGIDTHYAVSKPKTVGMILGWYIKVRDSP